MVNFVNFTNLGDFSRKQVKWSGARMNSDWVALESVLFKIFPGSQVESTKITATTKSFRCLSHSPIVGPILWSRYESGFLFRDLQFCGLGNIESGSPTDIGWGT